MKTINKIMTNGEIYQNATDLVSGFQDNETYFPAAISFCIQKNKNNFLQIAQEIEASRLNILQHYGTVKEDGSFKVEISNVDKANAELNQLLQIEQEVKIYCFKIEDLEGVSLTSLQTQAILFMIEED